MRGSSRYSLIFWIVIIALAIGLSCQSDAPQIGPPGGEEAAEQDNAEPTRVGSPPREPRSDMVASLRADLKATRHPSDGGGSAVLEEGKPARAGESGRWVIRYRASERGIAAGGAVYFQVSPFWGWSTPQTLDPARPGFTEVTTGAVGVELSARTLDQQLMRIEIGGRELRAGEALRIDYGAGTAGALADRYAEGESRFWIAVDGDGDGIRRVLEDSPTVRVAAGPAERLVLTLPSTARPGEPVRLTVALLDAVGNAFQARTDLAPAATVSFTGTLDGTDLDDADLDDADLDGADLDGADLDGADLDGADLPPALELTSADAGRRTLLWTPPGAGTLRLIAVAALADGGRLEAESPPLQVSERGARILWGDLQNHSGLSDGTGTPEELLTYARDVAALDVVALTDHDHWGLLFLDQHPSLWQRSLAATKRFHEPGRFVALPGYEWTNWIHGHRHVLFFEDVPEDFSLPSSIDPDVDHPEELWQSLEEKGLEGRVMTVAHHSAGGPISTDWSIPPDPRFEKVTEIVSVHGSSEAADAPRPIYRPVPGNFVRDMLARGHDDPRYRLGFIGSSDGHDGHPGLAHLASPSGGLAAILAEEATREAVWEALRARHTYATNGPRILLRATLGGYRMGDEVPLVAKPEEPDAWAFGGEGPVTGIPSGMLVVQTLTPGEIESIDVVRPGRIESGVCEAPRSCSFGLPVSDPRPGEYLYLRVVQKDGGAAWSSPFFFTNNVPGAAASPKNG